MGLFWIFACLMALGLLCYGLQIWAVRSFKADGRREGGQWLPPVSILKPLKGLDDGLFDNLESFCRLDYPSYEIIFALQDMNDPAYKVARKVKERHPQADISIVVERCGRGLNPKVNNLMPAYRESKHDYILISDSNVRVEEDYLKAIVGHMEDPGVGLVSNLIRGTGGRTMGAVFENLHLNSFVIGSVCFLERFLRMPCVVGKSMLMRKADLEAIGGLNAFRNVLAEDYLMGSMMKERGKKVVASSHLINNVNEYSGIRRFLDRHIRWGKLRWRIGGPRYAFELMGNIVFMSCVPLVTEGLSRATLSLALLVSLLKVLGDWYVGRTIRAGMHPLIYLLSPFKDLLIGAAWFVPLVSRTVAWRGNRYLIGDNSMLSPYPETGLWSWGYRLVEALKGRLA